MRVGECCPLVTVLSDCSTFDMDAWKRVYSNNDTATIALPYFWENFDKEHYSAWYCDYAEDLSDQMTFQTCNLVSGDVQLLYYAVVFVGPGFVCAVDY